MGLRLREGLTTRPSWKIGVMTETSGGCVEPAVCESLADGRVAGLHLLARDDVEQSAQRDVAEPMWNCT